MADSAEVLQNINPSKGTKISVIVANMKGVENALKHQNVDILGFPFSISETFLNRNTNKGQEEAFSLIQEILQLCQSENKQLNVYFSMAFGNPYGELWSIDQLVFWSERFREIGVNHILLSDTTATATLESIELVFSQLKAKFCEIEFSAHFHSRYEDSYQKIKTAYQVGCKSFDSVIKGFGGCPMAKDDLVGNIPTEVMINFLQNEKIESKLNLLNYEYAYNIAKSIFDF